MGYHTDFFGSFKLKKKLKKKDREFLTKLSQTRRMARKLDSQYGTEGEFFVDDDGHAGQAHEESIIDYDRPPKTQPSLWCQWIPNEAGTEIEWDGGEKFYYYVEWLQYLITNFLEPKNYVLNGEVRYSGEDSNDTGIIIVENNKITLKRG